MSEVYITTENMPVWLADKYFKDVDFISIEELYKTLEDLSCDYERLKEEFEDFKQNVEDNYKFMPTEEQIDFSNDW